MEKKKEKDDTCDEKMTQRYERDSYGEELHRRENNGGLHPNILRIESYWENQVVDD